MLVEHASRAGTSPSSTSAVVVKEEEEGEEEVKEVVVHGDCCRCCFIRMSLPSTFPEDEVGSFSPSPCIIIPSSCFSFNANATVIGAAKSRSREV